MLDVPSVRTVDSLALPVVRVVQMQEEALTSAPCATKQRGGGAPVRRVALCICVDRLCISSMKLGLEGDEVDAASAAASATRSSPTPPSSFTTFRIPCRPVIYYQRDRGVVV